MRSMLFAALFLTTPLLVQAQSADVLDPNEAVVLQLPTQLNSAQPAGINPVLYDNGPFVTSTGDGPGGANISLLQNTTLQLTTLGATCSLAGNFTLADDFVVPAGQTWNVTGARFYGYQTGSATAPSTFNGVRYQIWSGRPGDVGSTVLFGDLTTDRFVSSAWSNAYRFAENAIGTTRPVMTTEANVASPIALSGGTYWIEWQLSGTGASGPFCPPITMIGSTITGNAVQGTFPAGTYAPVVDGSLTIVPLAPPQGMPFTILGSTQAGVLAVSSNALSFGNQTIGGGGNATLTVSNTGNAVFSVTSLGGPAAPFSITGGTCGAAPFSIAAGGSCTIIVRFSPTAAGNATGSLVLNTDIPSTATVTLSGSGSAVVSSATVIPSNATWGLLALFGVILSLGLMMVARRNS